MTNRHLRVMPPASSHLLRNLAPQRRPRKSNVAALVLVSCGILSCTSAVPIASDDPTENGADTGTQESTTSTSEPAGSEGSSTTSQPPSAGSTSTAGTSFTDETTSSPLDVAELAFEYLGPPTLQLGSVTEGTVVVSNVGLAPANALSLQAVSLSIVENDCGDVLEEGSECRLTVELSSVTLGPTSAGVVVAYSDDLGPSEASIVLELDNLGETENLLPDSGFESCPVGQSPSDWVGTAKGEWSCLESWSSFQPYAGNRMVASGSGPFGEGAFRLNHVVDLKPYAHAIATGAAGIAVRGHAASGYGDQQRLELLEWSEDLEGSWVMGTEFSDTDLEWLEFDERALLSSASGSATLSFECLQIEGKGSAIPYCNSYFDSFEIRVVYPLY